MTSARGLLSPLVVVVLAGSVTAQPFFGQGGFVAGGAVNFRKNFRGGALSITAGGYGYGFAPLGYPGFGGPFGYPGFAPGFFPPINNSITIVNVAPPPPPIIIVPPLVEQVVPARFDRLDDLERQQAQLPPVIERPPPGEQIGGFRPIPPGNREQARQPIPPEPKPPEPKPPEPKPKPPEPKPGQLWDPPAPHPDPKVEYQRQLKLGQEAFAQGQYGRAAFRFRTAITIAPEEPMAHFLLGQSLYALAKYDEAVAALVQGLRRQPDWPVMGFRPLRLYEGNFAEYPEQLRRLEAVLDQEPDDPVLLFLYAYQLWFDGRQDEAIVFFEMAAPRLPDRNAVECFLKHRPPTVPVV